MSLTRILAVSALSMALSPLALAATNNNSASFGTWRNAHTTDVVISAHGIESAYQARAQCQKMAGFKHQSQQFNGTELKQSLSRELQQSQSHADEFKSNGDTEGAADFEENARQIKATLPLIQAGKNYHGIYSVCGDGALTFVQLSAKQAFFVADGGGIGLYYLLSK